MAQKGKILIIGATGYIGKILVKASVKDGRSTFAFVRESKASSPDKSELIESFKSSGVTVLYGDIYNHESLVKAIKQVDAVISAVGFQQLGDQTNIIAAIKEAGNIKEGKIMGGFRRFLPSEFGTDVDRFHAVEPAASLFAVKASIRRSIEAAGIPYTYIVSNGFAESFLRTLGQAGATAPPRDKVLVLGDGNIKAIFVKEEDIDIYTIKAVDDPRTLNKILYMRPPANILSFNEIVALWEKKISKTVEKIHLLEDELLEKIRESPAPTNIILSIGHSVLVKGDGTNYEIDASFGVEASEIYPEVQYTTVEEILDRLV